VSDAASVEVRVHEAATRDLLERVGAERRSGDPFEAARRIARLAGARCEDGRAEFGLWCPDLPAEATVELETLQRLASLPHGQEGEVPVRRRRLPMVRDGAWAWLAVTGAVAGARDHDGTLYRFVLRRPGEEEVVVGDPLAASLPFGLYGPAELYDVAGMHVGRADLDLFRRLGIGGEDEGYEPPRAAPPATILQIHVGTATHGGTLADLADLYRALGDKVRAGRELTPAESAFVGYDAVELLPVEPVVEDPRQAPRFELRRGADGERAVVRPVDTIDWGYDTAIFGAAAVSPALLRSGRPDELLDLAVALHTFPGKPIQLVLDVVFGHADAAGEGLLPARFFLGRNMYGLDLDFRDPTVRALLLEMQRRKVDVGADGVRVDAAQDHKILDEERGVMVHDDAYLREMSAVVQQIGEIRYRPFMIFEDGRPWPREDWETASTYRDVILDQPHAFQWGPLTFAHNTPFLEGFWNAKWWRVEEMARHGGHWISGCANHDTLRRGHQTSHLQAVNRRLGADLPEILRRGYDHPAADLLFYGFLPGVPMTFVAAPMRAPWAFMRASDDRWAVKVAAEEAGVFVWRFGPEAYAREDAFGRLKAMGLGDHAAASGMFGGLERAVADGADEAHEIAAWLAASDVALPWPPDAERLTALAHAFMRDLHDACVVWRGEDRLDPERLAFGLTLRRARRARPWLRDDLRGGDRFERVVRDDGSTLAYGLRHAPDGSEVLAVIVNLEGDPWTLRPADLLGEDDWRPLLAAPGVSWPGSPDELTLRDAEGVLLHVPA
jgi:hypothetical protein